MQDYLKVFLIGFSLGVFFSLLIGGIVAIFSLAAGLTIILTAGLFSGFLTVIAWLIFKSIPPQVLTLLGLLILVAGLLTFQPELDAVGAFAIALPLMGLAKEEDTG